MPSKLVNLKKKLMISDFSTKDKLKDEGSNENGFIALTKADFSISFGGAGGKLSTKPLFDATPEGFALKDDITVTINFDKAKSWMAKWVKALDESDQRKQFLLDHEQGHYDIVALVARDFFIDLMQLKQNVYRDQASGESDVTTVHSTYATLLAKIDKKYDDETNHRAYDQLSFGGPRKPAAQTKWEGLIRKAFTDERTPRVVAPDGVAYKVTLKEVLTQAGMAL